VVKLLEDEDCEITDGDGDDVEEELLEVKICKFVELLDDAVEG